MQLTRVRLPRLSAHFDPLDALNHFHDAIRDVLVWIPTIAGEQSSPRDGRWLRAFLQGPLAWHLSDEEEVFLPRLARVRKSSWLDACIARAFRNHQLVEGASAELLAELEPLCRGEDLDPVHWQKTTARLARARLNALAFEDDLLICTARLFLNDEARAELRDQLSARDGLRSWTDVEVAGDAPVPHRVHAVRTRKPNGLDQIRSFAECPRGRSASVDTCASCAHLQELNLDANGRGQVGCAIDDSAVPAEMRVADVMTREVACVDRDAPLLGAVELLAERGVSGLPVLDARGVPIGIVSQTDVVHALAAHVDLATCTVNDVMMHAPFFVREQSTIVDAARLLAVEHIHRLPVINDQNLVVGVVSALDLVRASLVASRA